LGSSSSCWFFRKRLASSRALNTVIISKTSLAKSSSKGRILALVQGSWFGAETQQVVFVRKHKAIHRIIQNASNQALQSLVVIIHAGAEIGHRNKRPAQLEAQ
jgi:hypothetical protein